MMPTDHRKIALDRAKEARKKLKKPDYLEFHPQLGLMKIYCKWCGGVIQQFRDLPGAESVSISNGQPIKTKRVVLAANSSYTEVEMTFTDGSKHITPICKECAKTGISTEELNNIYAADMEAWDEEEKRGNGKVSWEYYASRDVISYRQITDKERTS